MKHNAAGSSNNTDAITLFLCGDVMTGRGVDQILPHPVKPHLYESYVKNAVDYVRLAERINGPIPKPVASHYIWGDALAELEEIAPDFRIINLETSVTTCEDFWPDKGINYRMHPDNIACITQANIDCCVLANNHVLDWGYEGLDETLLSLQQAHIQVSGAGQNLEQAQSPAVLKTRGQGRVLVFSFAFHSSGTPYQWSALPDRAGVNLIDDAPDTLQHIAKKVAKVKQDGDIVIASIHWGGNWGYEIPRSQQDFAHQLIDKAGVDLVHGHSSHHVKGIEVYREKLILYGSGDFLNDYEGIEGNENYRGDLTLMYFPTLDWQGNLASLLMTPMQIRQLRLNRVSAADFEWLMHRLNREGVNFGTSVSAQEEARFYLHWR